MKIAFDGSRPAQEKLLALLEAASCMQEMNAIGHSQELRCSICAYDQGELVGYGCVAADGSVLLVTAPTHRHRSVAEPMLKLLTNRAAPVMC